MASIDKFLPTLLQLEGGYTNNPYDKGGATNAGITLATYQSYYGKRKTAYDLKHITMTEIRHIYKTGYWDQMKADQFKNQSVANIVVDFAVNSGTTKAAKKLQQLLGVEADGQIGPKTLAAINGRDQQQLFSAIETMRENYYNQIVYNNPTQRRFLKGWFNRIRTYKYEE